MNEILQERYVCCPFCGEGFVTLVDASAGTQHYVEDCQICCNPIVFSITVGADGNLEDIDVRREND